MATSINLFPARVRFVNPDGTLTPEAYRALQGLVTRTGDSVGGDEVDLFGFVMGVASGDMSGALLPAQEAIMQQPVTPSDGMLSAVEVKQEKSVDFMSEMTMQR